MITYRSCAAVFCVLLLCACSRSDVDTTEPIDDAVLIADLRARYGYSEDVAAEIRLYITPPNAERVRFSIKITADADGGVLLSAFEKGIQIFDGHLDNNGNCTLLLLRDDLVLTGDLEAAAERERTRPEGSTVIGLLLGQLPMLIDEVRRGPLPGADTAVSVSHAITGIMLNWDLGDGFQAEASLDGANESIISKRVSVRDEPRFELHYDKFQTFDGNLYRSRKVDLDLAGSEVDVSIKLVTIENRRFDDRWRPLDIPGDWRKATLIDYLDALHRDSLRQRETETEDATPPSPTTSGADAEP